MIKSVMILFLTLCLVEKGHGAQKQELLPPSEGIEEIISRLEVSAETVRFLWLPYSAYCKGEKAGDLPVWKEEGVVGTNDGALQVRMHHWTRGGSWKWYNAIWNGAEASVQSGLGRLDEPHVGGIQALDTRNTWSIFPLSSSYLPHRFGMAVGLHPIGTYLRDTAKDVKLLGRRNVRGVDCAEVLLDKNGRLPNDGVYDSPMTMLIDDRGSLLALTIQNYVHPDALRMKGRSQEEIDLLKVNIEGSDWIPYEARDVMEFSLVDGAYIPTSLRLSPSSGLDLTTVWLEVDASKASVGRQTEFEREEDTGQPVRVRDAIRGADFFLLPDGSKREHQDVRFLGLVKSYLQRRADGEQKREAELEPSIPWAQSSCGPDALYFASHVLDHPMLLRDLIDLVPEKETEQNITSIATLRSLAASSGLQTLVVTTKNIDLVRAFSGVVILHQSGRAGGLGHFGILDVRGLDGEARLISPPSTSKIDSIEGLLDDAGMLTLLLVAETTEAFADFYSEAEPTLSVEKKIGAVVGSVVVLLLLLGAGRRKGARACLVALALIWVGGAHAACTQEGQDSLGVRSANSTVGLNPTSPDAAGINLPVEGTSFLVNGEHDEHSENIQKSVLLGATFKDIGTIDPGQGIVAKFEWMHMGDSAIELRAERASCQCTRFSFSKKEIKPGELVMAEVHAAVPSSPGNFEVVGEFEEIHPGGQVVRGTITVVGRVLHGVTVFSDPSEFRIEKPASGLDARGTGLKVEGLLIAKSLAEGGLPRSLEPLTAIEGILVTIGEGTTTHDESGESHRTWPVKIEIDSSDIIERGKSSTIHFGSTADGQSLAAIRLVWQRNEPYPFDRASGSVKIREDLTLSHRIPIVTAGTIRVIPNSSGLSTRVVGSGSDRIVEITGAVRSESSTVVHSVRVQCGPDWPVSYALSCIRAGS